MPELHEKDSINPHYVFWFVVYLTTFVFVYIILVTFMHVPKENQRFVDTAFGVLLGTVLTGGISYLIGGSPGKRKDIPPNESSVTLTSINTPPIDPSKEAPTPE